jgi:hypothetical protein
MTQATGETFETPRFASQTQPFPVPTLCDPGRATGEAVPVPWSAARQDPAGYNTGHEWFTGRKEASDGAESGRCAHPLTERREEESQEPAHVSCELIRRKSGRTRCGHDV